MDYEVVWFGSLAVARSTLAVTTERSSNALPGRSAACCVVVLPSKLSLRSLTSLHFRRYIH